MTIYLTELSRTSLGLKVLLCWSWRRTGEK